MMAFGWAINVIQRGEASMGRLNKIFGEIPEISDLTEATWSGALKGRIEMRGLTFSPGNGGNPLLRDIHLTVHKGERIVIVGRIGAGKTVLCDLLVRILEPPKGRIFFDGIEIHHIPLKVLRRDIGYVPQETLLFWTRFERILHSETWMPLRKRLKRRHGPHRFTRRSWVFQKV
jgi:ATP-binding cassette subfamily B protein